LLIVDDDPAICAVMQMGLEADGTCRTTSAATADAALGIALYDRPDAAIIDAVLPQVPGLALACALVELGVPVLITSGEPLHQQLLSEAGCRFLQKPFHLSQLCAESRLLLDQGKQRLIDLAASLDRLANATGELADVLTQSRQLLQEARRQGAERRSL
jgi:DNA-binding response OmpR family regulator